MSDKLYTPADIKTYISGITYRDALALMRTGSLVSVEYSGRFFTKREHIITYLKRNPAAVLTDAGNREFKIAYNNERG